MVALGQGLRDAGDACAVGFSAEEHTTATVLDHHVGTSSGLAPIQRRDPDERRLTAPLEVDSEVGHQRACRDVVGLRVLQQGLAQTRTDHFDDIEPRTRKRDADHLELATAPGSRHGEATHGVAAAEHAGTGVTALAPFRLRSIETAQPVEHITRRLHPQQARVEPGGGRGIAGQRQLRARQGFLYVAQRDRQCRVRARLDNAEACREFRQWRRRIGLDREREALGIDQRPARIVGQAIGHAQDQRCPLGQRRREAHAIDESGTAQVVVDAGFPDPSVRTPDLHALGQRHRHRRREPEADRQHRDAIGLGIHALAAEACDERGTHPERERLIRGGRDTRRGGNTLAPHQPDLGAIGQPRSARQQRDRQPVVVTGAQGLVFG